MQHILDAYRDDYYKWITYCRHCGIEEPQGECDENLLNKTLNDLTDDAYKKVETACEELKFVSGAYRRT